VSSDDAIVIEVFGEGKTDVGHNPKPQAPRSGVVPLLLYALCGKPERMLVKRFGVPFLQQKGQGKGLWQKVRFAKRQAYYNRSSAAVFVVDSEGDLADRQKHLAQGRDADPLNLPMAIGVAHPCIESWLLADGPAIRRALGMEKAPAIPDRPEDLPAPCRDDTNNPKAVLRRVTGASKKELATVEKDRIATAMNDLDLLRTRCPLGFAPFAAEVVQRIRPLFSQP
jgi:hypothetical protein